MLCHLIITVTHTIQITGIAKIYYIDCTDSSRYKIGRFCNTASAFDDSPCDFTNIHAITYFQKIHSHA